MILELPTMRCDDHCGKCCGVVGCNAREFRDIARFARERNIRPIAQGTTCPFYQDGRCAVYEVRPWICRVYGHFAEATTTCPLGYNVNVSGERQREIEDAYRSDDGEHRLLHEMVYTDRQIKRLIKDYLQQSSDR